MESVLTKKISISQTLLVILAVFLTSRYLKDHQWDGTSNSSTSRNSMNQGPPPDRSTKLFCTGDSLPTRKCTIYNLCLTPQRDSFIFLISNDSHFIGLQKKEQLTASMFGLLDMSSLPNHNVFWLQYSPVPLEQAQRSLKLRFIDEPVFIMTTFLAGNLAHTIRDDILPLFYTYEELCRMNVKACTQKYRLLLMQTHKSYNTTAHANLYRAFSQRPIWNLATDHQGEEDHHQETHLCFSHAEVGLRKDIRYYDIGATELDYEQPLEDTTLAPRDVDRFTNFLIESLCKQILEQNPYHSICSPGLVCKQDLGTAEVVIFNRVWSRRIVNQDELVDYVTEAYGRGTGRVQVYGLESHPLIEVICAVQSAKLVIGMHGALLELAHFLQPGSALLEIFPYALNPDNYMPYRTICERLRKRVKYFSWQNTNPQNTIYTPNGPHDGHIHHLAPKEQWHIRNLTEVPRLDCCNDLRFRYWLNHDTVVDLESFSRPLSAAFEYLRSQPGHHSSSHPDVPIEVIPEPSNVTVRLDESTETLVVSWEAPVAQPSTNASSAGTTVYLVKFLNRATNAVKVFSVDRTSVAIDVEPDPGSSTHSFLISVEVALTAKNQVSRRAYIAVMV